MNPVQEGYLRDKRILALIDSRKALDTYQIYALVFKGIKFGLRKTQDRLMKLLKMGHVKRVRPCISAPYIYYINKKPGQLDHIIAVNWIYVWFNHKLRSGDSLTHWSTENGYAGMIRDDAFVGIYNTFTDQYRFWFVELDRSENDFNKKVKNYNKFFAEELYTPYWWALKATFFPKILVVVEDPKRVRHIAKAIEDHNKNSLQFEVKLLEDIRKEIVPVLVKGA